MSRAHRLFTLQRIEQELAEKREQLQKVCRALRGSRRLVQARHAFEEAEAAFVAARQRQRELEMELAAVEEKIAQEEERLYSGSIRHPKELHAIQQEVEGLKKRQNVLSTDLIAAIDDAEQARQRRDEAATALRLAEADWQKKQAKLTNAEAKLSRYLDRLEQKRTLLRSRISPTDLERYDYLVERKGLPVVAPLSGETCGLCGVTLSHNKIVALRRGELVQCGNCDRIVALDPKTP